MTELKTISLADKVFEQLESDILTGNYKQGELLTEAGLSREMNVSRTPIREAIRRLEQEDLVRETPKGHVVTGISEQDICDIYDIRLMIEGEATAKCAKIVSDEILEKMREVIELQEFYTEKCDAEKIKTVDTSFHELIYYNCGSQVYGTILSTLHRKVQLGRKTSFSCAERAKQAVNEHREIYSALACHNEALSKALAIKHINNAKISIMRLK